MSPETESKFNIRAKIVKALAHPTRLFIVDQLSKKEKCVCALTEMVGVDISTVSKHLAILKEAGIVEDEKRGLQVCYRLKKACTKKFMKCINTMAVQSQHHRK
jgi:DNA-binding transcriptional ArsR family regulator